MSETPFAIGRRIAFNLAFNRHSVDEWAYGTVTAFRDQGLGPSYRISWDDGFSDREGDWYGHHELVSEAEARANVEA